MNNPETFTMIDAAVPPSSAPAGIAMVGGYLGRQDYTPHIWTPGQWQPFAEHRQIPFWVPNLRNLPDLEAAAAVSAALALGWAAHKPASENRVIEFDFETDGTAADREWWAKAATTVEAAGFTGVVYGSLDTVLELAASYVHVADWTDVAQLQAGQTLVADQYQAGVPFGGTQIDYSRASRWLYDRAGRGARHQS